MGNTFRRSEYFGHQLEMEFAEAAWAGDLSRIQELVQQVDTVDKEEALRRAAGIGHLDLVRYLAEHCGTDVNSNAKLEDTALMWAARSGKFNIVWYLAERFGANVNSTNKEGDTALLVACRYGHIRVVRYLAEQCGADVNAKNAYGNSAVRFAVDSGNHEMQRILTPFLRPTASPYTNDGAGPADGIQKSLRGVAHYLIPPSEVDLTVFCHSSSVGGDFRAKWLDADVVVKILFQMRPSCHSRMKCICGGGSATPTY